MRRLYIALVLFVALIIGATLVPVSAQDGTVQHVVRAGDTLYSIARQYNVTVDAIVQANNIPNPSVIYLGQVLIIPSSSSSTPLPEAPPLTATPSVTPGPGEEVIHTVQRGENLFRISRQYGTTVQAIMVLNNLVDPNVIYINQRLRIPVGATSVPAMTTTPATPGTAGALPQGPRGGGTTEAPPAVATTTTPVATTVTATPETATVVAAETETATPPPATGPARNIPFSFGVHVELLGQDAATVADHVVTLGMEWVKQEIDWGEMEPTRGQVDFPTLDTIVETLEGTGASVLLTVTNAPDWARSTVEADGPPANYADYANFVGALASRYAGRVSAYEIWSEPNLRQNWTGKPLNGSEYMNLLQQAHGAIKGSDSAAIVVSAGLAPTGLDDGVNAVADRNFLRQMYQAGLAQYSDAVGVHPYGWGNAPDSTCCGNDPSVLEWDDSETFFFSETLTDYRDIMTQFSDSRTFLWVTEFGWGSSDGFPVEVDPAFGFVEYVSLDEQAQHTVRAFQIARDLGYVGPMFVWNLNQCQVGGLASYKCFWSMLDPAGNPRPVYHVLRDLEK